MKTDEYSHFHKSATCAETNEAASTDRLENLISEYTILEEIKVCHTMRYDGDFALKIQRIC